MSALSCVVCGVRDDLVAGCSIEDAARNQGVDVCFVRDLVGDGDFLCSPNPDVEAHYLGEGAPLIFNVGGYAGPMLRENQPASLPF